MTNLKQINVDRWIHAPGPHLIVGPSGCGKTELMQTLLSSFKSQSLIDSLIDTDDDSSPYIEGVWFNCVPSIEEEKKYDGWFQSRMTLNKRSINTILRELLEYCKNDKQKQKIIVFENIAGLGVNLFRCDSMRDIMYNARYLNMTLFLVTQYVDIPPSMRNPFQLVFVSAQFDHIYLQKLHNWLAKTPSKTPCTVTDWAAFVQLIQYVQKKGSPFLVWDIAQDDTIGWMNISNKGKKNAFAPLILYNPAECQHRQKNMIALADRIMELCKELKSLASDPRL